MTVIRLGVRENVLSDPGWLTRSMWGDALESSGNANTWMCECDGQIVGFASGGISEADIWALFVAPDYEGRGIGAALLLLATDWLFAAGVEVVRLGTRADSRADGFYLHRGWRRGELTEKGEVIYRLQRPASPGPAYATMPVAAIDYEWTDKGSMETHKC